MKITRVMKITMGNKNGLWERLRPPSPPFLGTPSFVPESLVFVGRPFAFRWFTLLPVGFYQGWRGRKTKQMPCFVLGVWRSFLDLHAKTLCEPTLVISLKEPGGRPLVSNSSEGPIVSQYHRPTGPALIERLRWSGANIPQRRSWDISDAREALRRGYRAVSLSGGNTESTPESTLEAADYVETLMRWFAKDIVSVAVQRGDSHPHSQAEANL